MIKFIKYTGEYPNLCYGILTLDIDGDIVEFGYDYNDLNYKFRYPPFWVSGGCCRFNEDYSEAYVSQEPWELNDFNIPEKYKYLSHELIDIFNENVHYGCCGGCL